jgi:CubicO group peptidase (beta-lactamase class C family)
VNPLEECLDAEAVRTEFSGVVRVDMAGTVVLEKAYRLADRGHQIPNTVATQFGIASGTKGLTALVILSLVDEGRLSLSIPVRSVLDADALLVDEEVTIEHLLSHRSGIGDYLDKNSGSDVTEQTLAVTMNTLVDAQDYLELLKGVPQQFRAGTKFQYCNAGFILLALIAERVSGHRFHELVDRRVCRRAGMAATEFLRSDELPGRAALGYLSAHGLKTNIFHLPVIGSGDGGIYSTVADLTSLWTALFEGNIVSDDLVAELVRSRSWDGAQSRRYGLGFWLHESTDVVMLEGRDCGVSFRSSHEPAGPITRTVISNITGGAWPLARAIEEWLSNL